MLHLRCFQSKVLSRGFSQKVYNGNRPIKEYSPRRPITGENKSRPFIKYDNNRKDFRKAERKPYLDASRIAGSLNLPYQTVAILKDRVSKLGSPLVYKGDIQEVRGSPKDGDLVFVVNSDGKALGRGFYNSFSQFSIRKVALPMEPFWCDSVEDLLSYRIDSANSIRNSLSLPSQATTAYRLVHGDGDYLSGLVVDVYNELAIIQSSAFWVEKYSEIILKVVAEKLNLSKDQIIWKSLDGKLQKDMRAIEYAAIPNMHKTESLSLSSPFIVKENGLSFQIDPLRDQKTGFYCDQRDTRYLIRRFVKGKNVLDGYCYSGGFTLNALLGGAASVTSIDSSESAIARLRTNVELNSELIQQVTGNDIKHSVNAIEGDFTETVRKLIDAKTFFDLVICDPPKLAPNHDSLHRAKSKYVFINSVAMEAVNPAGGLLLTCTCSAPMTLSGQFMSTLQRAARAANRRITVLGEYGAAGDHTTIPGLLEGTYLKAVLLHVQQLSPEKGQEELD